MDEITVFSQLLRAELDLWGRKGITARFWWRDDDATDGSDQLESLAALAASNDLTVGLAVIPGRMQVGLPKALEKHEHLVPLCHGYVHKNHSRSGPMAEFGPDRPLGDLISDAKAALREFRTKLGDRGLPVFAVPFNRIAQRFEAELPAIGFTGMSAGPMRWERSLAIIFGALRKGPSLRNRPAINSRRFRVDAHLSPIEWIPRRAPTNPYVLARRTIGLLAVRRLNYVDRTLPIGIVTHHLDHSPEIWHLTRKLIEVLKQHPAAHFLSPREIFPDYSESRRVAESSKRTCLDASIIG